MTERNKAFEHSHVHFSVKKISDVDFNFVQLLQSITLFRCNQIFMI